MVDRLSRLLDSSALYAANSRHPDRSRPLWNRSWVKALYLFRIRRAPSIELGCHPSACATSTNSWIGFGSDFHMYSSMPHRICLEEMMTPLKCTHLWLIHG